MNEKIQWHRNIDGSWAYFIPRSDERKTILKWIKENLTTHTVYGLDSHVDWVIVRIGSEEDSMLFKLNWCG